MFEIDAQNLPFVRTRQALLLLDLQNDFVSTGGILPVETPPDFVDKILELVPEFRNSDSVIWVRSVFEASRAVNATLGESESVITDKELPVRSRGGDKHLRQRARPSKKLIEAHDKVAEANGRPVANSSLLLADIEAEDVVVDETFLTIPDGRKPQVVLPTSPGTNFTEAVSKCIDRTKDLICEKSSYSAFKDGKLVQVLRAKFVTGIYLCGALTNISVFATAMDAARHGYTITIVEDCLGYRSKPRHDEAIRKLMEFTGCELINSQDLVGELRRKAQKQQAPPRRNQRTPPGPQKPGLEDLMANLNLRPDRNQATTRQTVPTGPPIEVAAAEPVTASESLDAGDESLNFELPPRPPPRERVKSKVKTRRRHSRSAPKDSAGPSAEKGPLSPTAATLNAASQALEKSSSIEEDSSAAVTPDGLSTQLENLTMEPRKGNEMSPDQFVEGAKKGTIDAGLTPLCAGDTTVIADLLDPDLAKNVFERIRDEVRWQKMSHQGGNVPRLVAVQGEVAEDGSIPIYRHPADESPPLLPFSATVSLVRAQVEKKLGHSVNHVLIQFYRDGMDYISEHSDKTLDIVPWTFIANVSLGAQRTMVFRTKKEAKTEDGSESVPRQASRAPLPHNSMCKMGLVTNMRWLHGIRQDKRMITEKSKEELAYDGGRISLTFRSIGTFLDKDQQKIWGQGAIAKTKEAAGTVVNGDNDESERMIRAFGKENHSSEFDWKEHYGEGFDVLHISNSTKLFLSGDFVQDARVKILLAEYNIPWTEGKLSPSFNWKSGNSFSDVSPIPSSLPVKFVDNDLSKSNVIGDTAIMLYLSAVHSQTSSSKSQLDLARQFTRLQQCEEILKKWRTRPFSVKPFRRELELFEAYATEAAFIAGSEVSLADFALWPILWEIREEWKNTTGLPNLLAYFKRMEGRESIRACVVGGQMVVSNAKGGVGSQPVVEEGCGSEKAPAAKGREVSAEKEIKGKGKDASVEKESKAKGKEIPVKTATLTEKVLEK